MNNEYKEKLLKSLEYDLFINEYEMAYLKFSQKELLGMNDEEAEKELRLLSVMTGIKDNEMQKQKINDLNEKIIIKKKLEDKITQLEFTIFYLKERKEFLTNLQ